MKSQKGVGLLQLVLIIIVLMMIAGATTYVVFQKNGPIDQYEHNIINNVEDDNLVNDIEKKLTTVE